MPLRDVMDVADSSLSMTACQPASSMKVPLSIRSVKFIQRMRIDIDSTNQAVRFDPPLVLLIGKVKYVQ